jgi:hypothetical protein
MLETAILTNAMPNQCVALHLCIFHLNSLYTNSLSSCLSQAMSDVNIADNIDARRIAEAYLRDVVIEEQAMEDLHELASAQRAHGSQVSGAIQQSLRSLTTENGINLAHAMHSSLHVAIPLYTEHHRSLAPSTSGAHASQSSIIQHCSGLTSAHKDNLCDKRPHREGKGHASNQTESFASPNESTTPNKQRPKGNGIYING